MAPELAWPDPGQLATLAPAAPFWIQIGGEPASSSSADGTPFPALQTLIFATVREGMPDSSGEPPASLPGVVTASVSAVALAAHAGARRVGLPLLGTGAVGFDVATVLEQVLPALRATLAAPLAGPLEQLVLIAPNAPVAEAIRSGWKAAEQPVPLDMLADAPIDRADLDVLGTGTYANTLSLIIDHPLTGTPLTIALNGPWGAGKTSLARLIEASLARNTLRFQAPIFCWFNAWHHDDAPNIVTALASTVARAAAAERSFWRRVFDPLPSRMLTPHGRRRRHLITTLLSVAVGLVVLFQAGTFDNLSTGRITLSVALALVTAAVRGISALQGTAADVGSLVRTPDAALASGSLDEVRTDLGRLIHQATQRGANRRPPREHRRLVVFIDDLERCQPARSIDVCETVSSLLAHEDVVVVLIGDMQTLATAAETKYKDLAPRYRTGTLAAASPDAPIGSFGELYLEKIIQFRFDIPTHDVSSLHELATRLLHDADGPKAEDDASVGELNGPPWVVRRRWASLVRPVQRWRARRELDRAAAEVRDRLESTGVDAGRFEELGGHVAELMALQLVLQRVEGPLMDECYRGVAEFVRPLPRDHKRMLNRIRFLLLITMDRNLLAPRGPLPPAAIGKWALLAERWPDLAIAVSMEPKILDRLLKASRSVPGFVDAMNDIVPGYARSAELQRLLADSQELGPFAGCLSRLRQPA
jgi:hypothetical protein